MECDVRFILLDVRPCDKHISTQTNIITIKLASPFTHRDTLTHTHTNVYTHNDTHACTLYTPPYTHILTYTYTLTIDTHACTLIYTTHTHTLELQLAALLGKTLLEQKSELDNKLRKLQEFAEETLVLNRVSESH